jgi:hypothetical protein
MNAPTSPVAGAAARCTVPHPQRLCHSARPIPFVLCAFAPRALTLQCFPRPCVPPPPSPRPLCGRNLGAFMVRLPELPMAGAGRAATDLDLWLHTGDCGATTTDVGLRAMLDHRRVSVAAPCAPAVCPAGQCLAAECSQASDVVCIPCAPVPLQSWVRGAPPPPACFVCGWCTPLRPPLFGAWMNAGVPPPASTCCHRDGCEAAVCAACAPLRCARRRTFCVAVCA